MLLARSAVLSSPILDANVKNKDFFFFKGAVAGGALIAIPKADKLYMPLEALPFLDFLAFFPFFIANPLRVRPANLGSSPLPQLKAVHLIPL